MPSTLHILCHAFFITTEADIIPFLQVRTVRLRELKCLFKVTQLVVEPGGELSNSKAHVLDHSTTLPFKREFPAQVIKHCAYERGLGGQRDPSPAVVSGLFVDQRPASQVPYAHNTIPANSKEAHVHAHTHSVEPTWGGDVWRDWTRTPEKERSPVECPFSGRPSPGLGRVTSAGWEAGMLRVSKGGRKGGKKPGEVPKDLTKCPDATWPNLERVT